MNENLSLGLALEQPARHPNPPGLAGAARPGRRAPSLDLSRLDRLPPHCPEAEQGVLGCILLDPVESMTKCLESFQGNSEVFYELRHQMLFQAMLAMHEGKAPIDVITLQEKLKDLNQLEAVGGVVYLSQLPDAVPSAANLDYYLAFLREKYLLRRLLRVCTEAASAVFDNPQDIPGLLDRVEQNVLQINQERIELPVCGMRVLARKALDKTEFLRERRGQLTGLASGFHDLDQLTDGFQPSEMIVVAARPSVGKTALAMNIAEHVALDLGLPVGVFSLEMSAEALVLRLLCSRARINLRDIRYGLLAEEDLRRLQEVSRQLEGAPMFIDDAGGLTILALKAKARRLRQKQGIALFIIDYLQLCRTDSWKVENRQQEIAEISHGLKELAKELKAPVLVLAQLNRQMEMADKNGKKRKPQLSDLRESGAIEQDADLVGLLYRWKEEDAAAGAPGGREAETINLMLAKHRNGPTGDIPLTFLKGYTRFENYAKIAKDDVPAAALTRNKGRE